jgi:predicted DNA-binding transcriptional regulator AlpA
MTENNFQKLLTRQDIAALGISYSNTHLLYLEKLSLFPKRIRLSAQRVVWDHSEILTWCSQRKNARSS